MLNNIGPSAYRQVSFGNTQKPRPREEKKFDLTDGVQTGTETAAELGAVAVGGSVGTKIAKSEPVQEAVHKVVKETSEQLGKYSDDIARFAAKFGDDAARCSKQLGKFGLEFGKAGYEGLVQTGKILCKIVPKLLI